MAMINERAVILTLKRAGAFLALMALVGGASAAFAQTKARMDLDDLMIKGEIHNDDRLMILARQKNELKNFVKFRTSFKEEILQELPASHPKKSF